MADAGQPSRFLIELGKALGLLSEGGQLSSAWLSAPGATSQAMDPQRQAHLRAALATLFGEADVAIGLPPQALPTLGAEVPAGAWHRADDGVPVAVVLGEDGDAPRLLGLGAWVSAGQVHAAVQGWLAGMDAQDFLIPPGDARVAPPILGGATVAFDAGPLGGVSLAAALSQGGLEDLAFSLTDFAGHASPPLDLLPASGEEALFSALRLAVFLAKAQLRHAAAQGDATAQRLVAHLLPLLGSTEDGPQPNPIPPFPFEALTAGIDPFIEWIAALFPDPAGQGNPSLDGVAALLTHLAALLGLAPPAGDGWEVWFEGPSAAGRAGAFASGDATRLTLGLLGERGATVDGVALTLTARADVLTAAIEERALTGASELRVAFTLTSPNAGAPLLAGDLGQALGDADLAGQSLKAVALGAQQHPARGLESWIALTLVDADDAETTLEADHPAVLPLMGLVLDALPAGAGSLKEILGGIGQELPFDLWLPGAFPSGNTLALDALRALGGKLLGQAPGALFTCPLGAGAPFSLEIGLKGNQSGAWLSPGQGGAAAVRFEGAAAGASDGHPGELALRALSPFFDALPARPALQLAADADGSIALSFLFVDAGGDALATVGIAPPSTPTLGEVFPAALSTLLWLLRDSPALASPFTPGGPCLGQVLAWAGLGAWGSGALSPASPAALAALTPLGAALGAVSGLLGAGPGGWTAAGPVEWKILSGGTLGISLRPKGGAPLIDESVFSLGFDHIDLVVLSQGQGGLAFAPAIQLVELAATVHGEGGAPLLDVGIASVGSATLSTSIAVDEAGLDLPLVALTLGDLRLPMGGGSGMASQLLPSDDAPGFDLTVAWASGALDVNIGGQPSFFFEIDRRFGPLDVQRLGVRYEGDEHLALLLDARFELGGVKIQPDGLGIVLPLRHLDAPDQWSFTLRGLGLSFDQGGIQISGLLRDHGGDYQGAALVKAFSFQLGAIGAYKQLADGPSLFLFAALATPLGGPPWFFVTGVAGGFGYNRALDVPDDVAGVAKLPFFGLMKGDLDLSQIDAIGAALDAYLHPQQGTVWIAGGLMFTSFALIKGQALLYVIVGPRFELGIMALAGFTVPNIVNVELALKARFTTGPDANLLIMGGLTDKSWLLGGACKLQGGFALQAWFNRGDVVLTAGGYSPDFKKPDHYPSVDRIGYRWALSDAIVLKGDCYFALTPREAMGGSHFDVTGKWGPLSAGYKCWFDALVGWDPFYFFVRLDVSLWGRVETALGDVEIEVGVHLKVHGPPVGGIASVDLAILSIDVPFGDQKGPKSDPLKIGAFLSGPLGFALPDAAQKKDHVEVPTRPVLDAGGEVIEQGLVTVEVDKGLVSVDGSAPEGTQDKPWLLTPEFRVALRTRIPLGSPGKLFSAYQDLFDAVTSSEHTSVTFFPSERGGLTSEMDLVYAGPKAGKARTSALFAPMPEALFGEGPAEGNSEAARPRIMGILLDGEATLVSSLSGDHSLGRRLSAGADELPLPLGAAGRPLATLSAQLGAGSRAGEAALSQAFGAAAAPMLRRAAAPTLLARDALIVDGFSAPAQGQGGSSPPPVVVAVPLVLVAEGLFTLPRRSSVPAMRTTAAGLAPEAPRIPAPTVRARPASLSGVVLRRAEADPRARRAAGPPARPGLRAASMATLTTLSGAMAREGASVHGGTTQLWRAQGIPTEGARLSVSGEQPVRITALGPFGEPLSDAILPAGEASLSLSARTRHVAVTGLGVAPRGTERAPSPTTASPVAGFDAQTTLLPVGRRTFLAPGCVLLTRQGRVDGLGSAAPSAGRLLQGVESLEVRFTGAPSGPSTVMVIAAAPPGDDPPPLSSSVTVGVEGISAAPFAVVGADRIALLYDVAGGRSAAGAAGPIARVEATSGWTVEGVALLAGAARDQASAFAARPTWEPVGAGDAYEGGVTQLRLEARS